MTRSQGVNGYPDRPQSLTDLYTWIVMDGVSLIAIDDKTGEVVGIRSGYCLTRDETKNVPRKTMADLADFPYAWATLMFLGETVCFPADFFEKYKEDKKMYCMFGLGTHRSYRGRGLGHELVRQSFEVCKKTQFDKMDLLQLLPILYYV
jgi:GNAT superfamily N-acetyltransferase